MDPKKRVVVTGASGWLASHIIYQLLQRDYKVIGTIRNVDKANFLYNIHPNAKKNLELKVQDLLLKEGWDDIMANCYCVMHVASPFTLVSSDEDQILKPAIIGTENVCNAAIKAGVKRFILTSSIVSIVYGHDSSRYETDLIKLDAERVSHNTACRSKVNIQTDCKDDCWFRKLENISTNDEMKEFIEKAHSLYHRRTNTCFPETIGSWKSMNVDDYSNENNIDTYEKSKTIAERKAVELLMKAGVEYVVLCPGFIFGPLLDKVHGENESSAHIKRLLKNSYPLIPCINSPHVDVRDAALCHILALEQPAEKVASKRFLVTCDDGNIDFIEQAKLLKDLFAPVGFTIRTTKAPNSIVKVLGNLSSLIGVAASKLNALTYTSNSRTYEDLGMKSWRSVEEALVSHAISMCKYEFVSKHKLDSEVLKAVQPY